jgi:hypothetical protein
MLFKSDDSTSRCFIDLEEMERTDCELGGLLDSIKLSNSMGSKAHKECSISGLI